MLIASADRQIYEILAKIDKIWSKNIMGAIGLG